MKSAQTHHIAVLTGDIVGSTALGAARLERAMKALEAEAARQEAWHGGPLHFTRHRGDGWQVVLMRPALALRSALAFRAALKAADEGFDSYIGLAIGESPRQLTGDLNSQNAAVFMASGHALDDIKTTATGVRMATNTGGDFNALTLMMDHKSQDWTQAQAKAVMLAIPPDADLFYTDMAKTLDISRQAVTKSLKSAWFEVIDMALTSSEQARET